MTADHPDHAPESLSVSALLNKNREWARQQRESAPEFFQQLSQGQSPEILWIGCSDSRVPPTEILQLGPGDVFTTRNIANVVLPSDLSLLSVLQYSVEVLKVKHVVVCGHEKCGGVKAAMGTQRLGLIDNWLQQIKDVYRHNKLKIDALESEDDRVELLVELNALNSLAVVASTGIVQAAWERGQELALHAWTYRLSDGLIRDLGVELTSGENYEAKINDVVAKKFRPAP